MTREEARRIAANIAKAAIQSRATAFRASQSLIARRHKLIIISLKGPFTIEMTFARCPFNGGSENIRWKGDEERWILS